MKMTFAGSIKSGLKNWSNFKGTATRTEFWYFYLFTVLLNMVTTTLDSIIAPGTDLSGAAMAGAGPLYLITNIALVLPNVSLAFRRFRDAGLSGSWLFLWALPFVAFVFGGGLALGDFAPLSENSSEADLRAYAMALAPAILVALGVGIFQFVINLRPSKSRAQGNKYAAAAETETSASE
ncbi:MAG: DUF805 domain-containing protein [Rhodoluna sp.]|jgi:uncharacterized membrane protein YhaH (DUF805 family)|nr:DUF805 domain-containing protein [Rhodoluna sp.]MBP7819154.1 DUF805 domain-containing protein [Rhodoluna sp.]